MTQHCEAVMEIVMSSYPFEEWNVNGVWRNVLTKEHLQLIEIDANKATFKRGDGTIFVFEKAEAEKLLCPT